MTDENKELLEKDADLTPEPDDIEGLKNKINELTYESKKFRKERARLLEELNALKSPKQPEDEDETTPIVKHDDAAYRKWQKEKEKIQAEKNEILQRYHGSILESELDKTISKYGGDAFFLKPLIKDNVKIEDNNGVVEVVIYENGVRSLDTLDEYINSISKDPKFERVFLGSKANGVPNARTRPGGIMDWASNPWSDEGWSWAKQGEILSRNPDEAARLKEAARGHNKVKKIQQEPRMVL
jgi:hypothetical protein